MRRRIHLSRTSGYILMINGGAMSWKSRHSAHLIDSPKLCLLPAFFWGPFFSLSVQLCPLPSRKRRGSVVRKPTMCVKSSRFRTRSNRTHGAWPFCITRKDNGKSNEVFGFYSHSTVDVTEARNLALVHHVEAPRVVH